MQGKIIEYIEQGRFFCAHVLQESGKRLRVMNQNGKELNLSIARLVHQSDQKYPPLPSREETMRFLQEIAERRQELMEAIDLEEIWELAVEEEEDVFPPSFLAELSFGETCDDDREAAFLRAVFGDPFFFKFKDNKIRVHSAEVVEQLREKALRERAKEEMLEKGARGLQAVMKGEQQEDCWPQRQECLDLLADYYLRGSEAREPALARELLKKAGFSRPHDPLILLTKAGIWQRDENVPLLKSDIPVHFDEEVLQEVERMAEPDAGTLLAAKRRDLRELPLITIDGELTRDFDDALHLEKVDGGYLVGIHITDVSEFVRPGSPFFQAACERGTSIYFPDRQIPMLPPALSEGVCSLIEGKSRPAISFLVKLTDTGEVVDFKVVRSMVEVKRRLTYTEAEALIAGEQDEVLTILAELGQKLQERRVEAGALIIPIPDVNIHVKEGGEVAVSLAEVDTLARTLVAEFMVLANTLGAQYLVDRQIPALYRTQEPPRKRLAPGVQRDLYTNFRQRRFLSRGYLQTEVKPHSGVGVQQYTTMTSPIRRLLDLVMQQQLANVLLGEGPLYSVADCRDFASRIQDSQTRVNQVRLLRRRYWLLKYLAMEVGVGNRLEALVLEIQPRRVQVVLTDLLLEADLPANQGMPVNPGDRISVTLAKASPLDNSFRLEW